MKINSENAKLQREIGRRLKAGKPVVGLLAGLLTTTAVAAEEKGSEPPLAGKPLPPKVEQCSHVRGLIDMEMPPLMGESPITQAQAAETNGLDGATSRQDGVDPIRAAVIARVAKDAKKFDRATRREIERLYRQASRSGDDGEAALKTLEEKYPEANRTGCAVMYAAQRAAGEERETLLKRAIEKYGDCRYGDGVQVAVQARWYLSCYYDKTGKSDEARKLREEIRTNYPDAVTHHGGKFSELIVTDLAK